MFNIVTKEQKDDLRKAEKAIEQFDILRQNKNQKVIYTTLDAFGNLEEKEGILKSVVDFVSIQIDNSHHRLFPNGYKPILLDISRRDDCAPLFSLSCTNEEIAKMRKQQMDNTPHSANGVEFYRPFYDLTVFLSLGTFGGIIPGLTTGHLDILEKAYEYVSNTRDTLIKFGIDPNNMGESLKQVLKNGITFKPSGEDIRDQLVKLKEVAEHIKRGLPEEAFSFGFRYPIEPTATDLSGYVRTAIEQKKSFVTMNTITSAIREESKLLTDNVK